MSTRNGLEDVEAGLTDSSESDKEQEQEQEQEYEQEQRVEPAVPAQEQEREQVQEQVQVPEPVQDDQDDQGQQMPDMDDANARSGSLSVKIPLFRGNKKKDSITPEAWVQTVDRLATVMKWNGGQTADAAIDAMRDEADVWRDCMTNGTDTEVAAVKDWALLKPYFVKRFARFQSAVEKVGLVLNLKQKPEEAATPYFDRVDQVMKKVTGKELAASNEKAGFIECRDVMTRTLFMAFLRPEVRVWVEANGVANDTTLADLKQRAVDVDEAVNSPGSAAKAAAIPTRVAAVHMETGEDEKQLQEHIASLQRQLSAIAPGGGGGAKPKAVRGGGARGGRGGGRGGFSRTPAEIQARKRWVLCHKCKQWGQHYQAECKLGDAEIGRLVPQQSSDEPSGNPFDSQFPN
jgi:hypothetical protein